MEPTEKRLSRSGDGADGAPVTNKLASAAHGVIEEAAGKAGSLETQFRTKAMGEAGDQIEQSLEKVQTFVRERPVAAAGIAFLAGVIATVWMRK